MTEQNQDGLVRMLRQTEATIKRQLAEIGKLDKIVARKLADYEVLTASFIKLAEQSQSNGKQEHNQMTLKMSQIYTLEQQIDQLQSHKNRLANSLYCSVSQTCQTFDDTMGEQWLLDHFHLYNPKFMQSHIGNNQLIDIFIKQTVSERHGYCICEGRKESGQMIRCDDGECEKRWYHLACLKMPVSRVPATTWSCPSCINKLKKSNN